MSATREYRAINRVDWPAGPWDAEPDKAQWVDPATNLDCLIVRNPGGAWCGYVGIAEGHPWFGIEYSGCTQSPCGQDWCEHSPESRVRVHGGLTFSDFCHEPTRENWELWRTRLRANASEAVQYPKGDTARALRDAGHLLDDYEAWKAYGESRFICHVPGDGRPARVWWFGFDCAHSGDFCPAYDRLFASISARNRDEEYRDRAYVTEQVARLASQLHAVGQAAS